MVYCSPDGYSRNDLVFPSFTCPAILRGLYCWLNTPKRYCYASLSLLALIAAVREALAAKLR
jgi:hypothetical protein